MKNLYTFQGFDAAEPWHLGSQDNTFAQGIIDLYNDILFLPHYDFGFHITDQFVLYDISIVLLDASCYNFLSFKFICTFLHASPSCSYMCTFGPQLV